MKKNAVFLRGLLVALVFIVSAPALAKSLVKNKCPKSCYPMLVMRVVDADTVQGYIHTNDDEAVIYAKLRLDGLDTPESRRPKCMEEKLLALIARDYLVDRLSPIIRSRSANRACACDAQGGKFSKRRIGSLKIKQPGGQNWRDVGKGLMKKCFAVPYKGGKKVNWCACLKNNNCRADTFPKRCISYFKRQGARH